MKSRVAYNYDSHNQAKGAEDHRLPSRWKSGSVLETVYDTDTFYCKPLTESGILWTTELCRFPLQ